MWRSRKPRGADEEQEKMVEEVTNHNQAPDSDKPGLGGIVRGGLSTKVGVSRQA